MASAQRDFLESQGMQVLEETPSEITIKNPRTGDPLILNKRDVATPENSTMDLSLAPIQGQTLNKKSPVELNPTSLDLLSGSDMSKLSSSSLDQFLRGGTPQNKDLALQVAEQKFPDLLGTTQSTSASTTQQPSSGQQPKNSKPSNLLQTQSSTTRSIQEFEGGPTESDLDELRSAFERRGEAQAKVIQEQAQAEGEIAAANFDLQRQLDRQNEQRQAVFEKRNSFQTQELDKLQKSLSAMEVDSVDPDRFFKNMSTGKKILSGIGLFLGGIGSAFTAQPNAAMQFIQKAIDDDINAQVENARSQRDLAKDQFSKQMSLYEANLQTFDDENRALDATKAQLLTSFKAQLQGLQAKAANKTQIARIDELLAKTDEEIAAATINFRDKTKTIANTQFTSTESSLPQKAGNSLTVRDKFGNPIGIAPSQDEAKKLNEQTRSLASFDQTINELIQLRQNEGRTVPLLSGEDKKIDAKAKTLAKNLQAELKTLFNLGALDKGSLEFMEDLIPSDPTAFFSTDASIISKLNTMKAQMNKSLQNNLRQSGIKTGPTSFQPGL